MDPDGAALTTTAPARLGRAALALVPVAFVALFFAYPVVSIIGRGIVPEGHLDLGAVADVFTTGSTRGVLWFTLWQATLSTVATVLLGIPAAFVLARYDFPGRRVLLGLTVIPFVLPTVVVGTAFLALGFRPSIGALLLAHVFFNYAVVVRTVAGLWAHLDPREEEAARVLGASPWRAFRTVTLPALRPAIAAATAIVFLFTFTSFGVVLVLGGPLRATLETEIYRTTAQLLDLRTAAALSIVQLLAVGSLVTVTGLLARRHAVAHRLRAARDTLRRPRRIGQWTLLAANLVVMAVLLGTPIAVLVAESFDTTGGPGFGYYQALGSLHRESVLFVSPLAAIRHSLEIALVSTTIAVVVGGLAAVVSARGHRLVEVAVTLPLGVSAVIVGFGMLVAFDEPPLDLRASWIILPIAHALVAVPFVVQIVAPVLTSIDPHLREAAAVLGASSKRVWREVDLPIASRALLVAAGFAFAISFGEFGATAFLARPDRPTLPVVIYRLLGQPGELNFGAAMAGSVLLMVVTACAVLAVDRFRAGPIGTF